MKLLRILLIGITLVSVIVFSTGCGEEEAEETQEEQIATVQTGDLALDISAVGNLALSEKETLYFELAGSVTEVLADEGDTVEEGAVLARLDTSDRQEYIKSLEREIELKDQALLQAEINHQNGEESLNAINSQAYIDQKTAQADLELANAKISLANAEDAYDVAYVQYQANWTIPERIRAYEQKKAQLEIAQINLADAEENQANVEADIELEREIKEKELVILKSKLEDAQKEYDEAVQDLADAQKQSWEILAPFTGYITAVKITEGQEVQKSTAAIEIANPDQFEAEVYVSEMDISNIAIGTPATVQIDSMPSMVLPAVIVKISPTANIQSGVVNYAVKVKIQAADMTSFDVSETMSDMFGDTESGELPPMLQQAVDAGRMTKEQAEELVDKMKSGLPSFSPDSSTDQAPPTGDGEESSSITVTPDIKIGQGDTAFSSGAFSGGGFTAPAMTSGTGFQLREGLTVTVSVVTDSRIGVLLVPSGAITTRGTQSFVTILNADETREEREITVGLSDWQNTEVLSGLTEGEQVVYTPVSEANDAFTFPIRMGSSSVAVR